MKFIGATLLTIALLSGCDSGPTPEERARDARLQAWIDAKPEREAAAAAQDRLVRSQQILDNARDEAISVSGRLAHVETLIQDYPGTEAAAQAAELLPSLREANAAAEAKAAARGEWTYIAETDQLTGKLTRIARVTSTNTINLDFPYQGAQHATLAVRDHPQWGRDVYVYIEQGQIICSSYECPVRVVFDTGRPSTLDGNSPADHSSETVFMPGYRNLTRRMAAADQMRVQVNIFKGGAPTFTFPVKGFNPKLVAP